MCIRLSFAPLWVRTLAFVVLATLTAGLFAAITWYQNGAGAGSALTPNR